MNILETNNLTKVFNGVKVVNSLNIKVNSKGVYGFLGPNGAGKTTTMRMLVGLAKPTSGEIFINGEKVIFGRFKSNNIGYLPDVPNFYGWMNAYENMEFFSGLFGMKKTYAKERIYYLLELVGLKNVTKKVGTFSRGMKQRLGIAQALINNPKIVFCDEPTSALDPIGRMEILELLKNLSSKIAIFTSSHILEDIERICDTVMILNKGNAIIEDNIDNLKNKYIGNHIEIGFTNSCMRDKALKLFRQNNNIVSMEYCNEYGMILDVSDINKAQIEIPMILSKSGIGIVNFNRHKVSLEEIFIKMVN